MLHNVKSGFDSPYPSGKIMAFGEHTSKIITGSKSKELLGKKIILCITGSVAAIRSPDIARELMRYGANVFVVMTPMAEKIIHPYTLEWATGNPVVTQLTGEIQHVTYGGEHQNHADLILVAPSTANTIGKVACGIDDTTVTTLLTTAIGSGIPVIIAPAMHASMYKHPIVLENIKKLEKIGVKVLLPKIEDGKAKIQETSEIISSVKEKLLKNQDLKGCRVLITAGPTRSYIDAFRYITNPSSGKTGIAIANEAISRGAEVTLVYGPATESPPPSVNLLKIETTEEMLSTVINELKSNKYDIAILSAAASDFGVPDRKMEKISSSQGQWVLRLVPLPKIIAEVKKIDPNVFLVGFKAEYNITQKELINRSFNRLKEMKMDLIVANDVSQENAGFGSDTNEVYIIDRGKNVLHINLTEKRDIATKLLDKINSMLKH